MADRFAYGIQHTVNAQAVTSLVNAALNFAELEEWCDLPNVLESKSGKLTAPVHGNEDTAQCGHDDVTQVLPQIEAFVAQLPHAVDTLDAIGLPKYFLKLQFNVLVNSINIPVLQIRILFPTESHFG